MLNIGNVLIFIPLHKKDTQRRFYHKISYSLCCGHQNGEVLCACALQLKSRKSASGSVEFTHQNGTVYIYASVARIRFYLILSYMNAYILLMVMTRNQSNHFVPTLPNISRFGVIAKFAHRTRDLIDMLFPAGGICRFSLAVMNCITHSTVYHLLQYYHMSVDHEWLRKVPEALIEISCGPSRLHHFTIAMSLLHLSQRLDMNYNLHG